jgi:hypothetical protein
MKQDENEQNHKNESTPVVDNKPNGKSQFIGMFDDGCLIHTHSCRPLRQLLQHAFFFR